MKWKMLCLFFIAISVILNCHPAMAEKSGKEPKKVAKIASQGMVFVNGGCFDMGDTSGEEFTITQMPGLPEVKAYLDRDAKIVHQVCLSDFYLDRTEVTQDAYEKITGNTPSTHEICPNCPVETVSWDEAETFCIKTGKRLPTEAEWEYAARGRGKNSRWAGTDNISNLGDFSWNNRNSNNETHPVGKKKPNDLGLYDMSGNIWEWVADWYEENYYSQSPKNNPKGPSGGQGHIRRGGSYYDLLDWLRTSKRGLGAITLKNDITGFRCAK